MAVKEPAPWLWDALKSIGDQDRQDWELCVGIDGKSEVIADSIRHFDNDARITTLDENSGASRCRNAALGNARAPIIAVLDADDLWLPHHLSSHVAAFDRDPKLILRGTRAQVVDEIGHLTSPNPGIHHIGLPFRLLVRNQFVHSSVAYRREIAWRLGGYPPGVRVGEDYFLWLTLAGSGRITNSLEFNVRYRRHKGQSSRNPIDLKSSLSILQAKEDLGRKLHVPRFSVRILHRMWLSKQRISETEYSGF